MFFLDNPSFPGSCKFILRANILRPAPILQFYFLQYLLV